MFSLLSAKYTVATVTKDVCPLQSASPSRPNFVAFMYLLYNTFPDLSLSTGESPPSILQRINIAQMICHIFL